jgi:hypothetical protein
MTFAPHHPKPKAATPPSIRGGLILLGIGLLATVVLPFFVPQPQGSAFTIVVVLALWAVGGPLLLVGLWVVLRALWKRGGGPFDPPS